MSKERELIKDMKILLECTDMGSLQRNADVLIGRAIELLAQPEQEQEPVAWKVIDKTNGEFMFSRIKPMERSYKYDVVIPLYTAPPKREPPMTQREAYQRGYAQAEMDLKRKRITDEEIYNRCCAMDNSYTCNFIDGVEWAEEHHGITGVDDDN